MSHVEISLDDDFSNLTKKKKKKKKPFTLTEMEESLPVRIIGSDNTTKWKLVQLSFNWREQIFNVFARIERGQGADLGEGQFCMRSIILRALFTRGFTF